MKRVVVNKVSFNFIIYNKKRLYKNKLFKDINIKRRNNKKLKHFIYITLLFNS
jgi:hypothetical protein